MKEVLLTWLMWLDAMLCNMMDLIQVAMSIGLMYGLYRLIKYFIRYHAECQNEFAEQRDQKQHIQRKVDDINRELDEIEATLNAVSEAENSDGKITPIWNAKPPKR